MGTAAAVMLFGAALAATLTGYVYRRFDVDVQRFAPFSTLSAATVQDSGFTILVGAFPIASTTFGGDVESLTSWLQTSGFRVYYSEVDLGARGRWQRVLAGAYGTREAASRDASRLKAA